MGVAQWKSAGLISHKLSRAKTDPWGSNRGPGMPNNSDHFPLTKKCQIIPTAEEMFVMFCLPQLTWTSARVLRVTPTSTVSMLSTDTPAKVRTFTVRVLNSPKRCQLDNGLKSLNHPFFPASSQIIKSFSCNLRYCNL